MLVFVCVGFFSTYQCEKIHHRPKSNYDENNHNYVWHHAVHFEWTPLHCSLTRKPDLPFWIFMVHWEAAWVDCQRFVSDLVFGVPSPSHVCVSKSQILWEASVVQESCSCKSCPKSQLTVIERTDQSAFLTLLLSCQDWKGNLWVTEGFIVIEN